MIHFVLYSNTSSLRYMYIVWTYTIGISFWWNNSGFVVDYIYHCISFTLVLNLKSFEINKWHCHASWSRFSKLPSRLQLHACPSKIWQFLQEKIKRKRCGKAWCDVFTCSDGFLATFQPQSFMHTTCWSLKNFYTIL